MTTILPI